MARRTPNIGLAPVIAALGAPVVADDVTTRVLDAAAELLAAYGIGRWSVDDVADRSGLGRTTVYRRFDGRDQLVHAVLARECQRFFAAIAEAVGDHRRLEDQVVAGMLVGLAAFDSSVVAQVLRSDPDAILPLLTTDAGMIVAAARAAVVERYLAMRPGADPDRAAVVGEALIRLAMSLALAPTQVIPLDDPQVAAAALHQIVDPLVRPLSPRRIA
jgi:AcrR family transcriptional regulator